MSDLKIQGEVSLDTSNADAAFARIEQGGKRMAQQVEQAGQKAGKAVDSIGDGGNESAKKVDSATKSMIQSIQRTTAAMEAGSKSSSQYYEVLAKQRGVDPSALRPYLDQLEQVSAKQVKTGISAGQMTAALRGVPAQFTDIIVSLQGGQKPMTVLLQQGGQLKDMFGGIGPAAKALGGYMAGMVNPLTLAAGAVAGLGFAVAKLESSDRVFTGITTSLLVTGRQAIATKDELKELVYQLSLLPGMSRSSSEATVAEFAKTGQIGGTIFKDLAASVSAYAKATGQDAPEAAKQLAKAFADPVAGAKSLDAAFGTLSASSLLSIEKMAKQNNIVGAQALLLDELKKSLQGVSEEGMTPLQHATDGFRKAWIEANHSLDASEGLRTVSNGVVKVVEGFTWLMSHSGDIASALERALPPQFRLSMMALGALANIGTSSGKQESSGKITYPEAKASASQSNLDNDVKSALALGSSYQSAAARMEEMRMTAGVLSRAMKSLSADGKENSAEYKKLKDQLAGVNEAIKNSPINKELKEQQKLMLETAGLTGSFLKDWDSLNKAYARGGISLGELTKAQSVLLAKQPIIKAGLDEEKNAREELVKAAEKMLDGSAKEIKSLEDKLTKQRDHNAAIGLSKDKVAELAASKLELAAASDEELAANMRNAAAYAGDLHDAYIQQAADLDRIAKLKREQAGEVRAGGAKQVLADEVKKADEELKRSLDPSRAQEFGDTLRNAFKGAGDALYDLSNSLQSYGKKQAEIAKDRQNLETKKASGKYSEVELSRELAAINSKDLKSQADGYADMAYAAKNFFDEGSSGYKTLDGASKAYHAAQLAQNIIESGQLAVKAVLNQAQGDPYTAWARMAAMAAAVGALGYAVGGGFNSSSGDGMSAADRQRTQGTGTVLGDSSTKSNSILAALQSLDDNAFNQVRYSSNMLDALRGIEKSMSGLAQILIRSSGLTSGKGLNIQEGLLSRNSGDPILNGLGLGGLGQIGFNNAPIIGGIIDKLQSFWGKTTQSVIDSGISIFGSLADVSRGSGISQYADIERKTSSFFGLKKSTSYSTQYGSIEQLVADQFGQVFSGISESVKSAAISVGKDAIASELASYIIDIPKISLKGLKGQELQDALSSVFSGAADTMAQRLVPGFENLQKVGEGYYQTLIRVSDSLETANGWMSMLGKNLFQVSIAGAGAAAQLVDAFGGLDKMNEATQSFYEKYYSESERAARSSENMAKALASVNLSLPDTMGAFRDMVQSLDLTTDAGRKAYATLLSIAPEFADVSEMAARAAKDTGVKLIAAFADSQFVPLLADAQRSVGLLTDQIDTLRINADGATIDMEGLGEALANVNTQTFIETMAQAFESLADRIKGIVGSIANERGAVRDAAMSILDPSTMSKDAIQGELAGINTGLPSNADVVSAYGALNAQYSATASAQAALKSAQSTDQSLRDTLSAAQAQVAAANAAQAALDASAVTIYSDNEYQGRSQTMGVGYNGIGGIGNDQLSSIRVAAGYIARLFRDGDFNGGSVAYTGDSANVGGFDNQTSSIIVERLAGFALPAIEQANAALAAAQAQLSGFGDALAQAQAAYSAAVAQQGSASEQAKNAQMAYAAALQDFAIDASRSVSKLSRLREETVKYYEAQKQLADLMTNSAAGLRKSVTDYRYSQLAPEDQLAALRSQFSSAYSMALSTDGSTLSSYADKLNGLINPILEKAKEVYGDGTDYNALVSAVFGSAQNIASRLETLTPTNYAADSLQLLEQIDATLAALESSTQSAEDLIVKAIDASRDQTVGGLRAIVAALTGQSIPAFASGGYHAGGARLVGENGPELEVTGPSRIYSASQTRDILSGGGNAELVVEVRALRQENENLRMALEAIASHTSNTARRLERIEADGMVVRTEDDTPLKTEAV